VKVGDMVKIQDFDYDINLHQTEAVARGIILEFSRTGHHTLSAKVVFNDGQVKWFDTSRLEVLSEGGR